MARLLMGRTVWCEEARTCPYMCGFNQTKHQEMELLRRIRRATRTNDLFFIHTASAELTIVVDDDLSDIVTTVEADGSRFRTAAYTTVLTGRELTLARVRPGSEAGFLRVTVEVPAGDGIVAYVDEDITAHGPLNDADLYTSGGKITADGLIGAKTRLNAGDDIIVSNSAGQLWAKSHRDVVAIAVAEGAWLEADRDIRVDAAGLQNLDALASRSVFVTGRYDPYNVRAVAPPSHITLK